METIYSVISRFICIMLCILALTKKYISGMLTFAKKSRILYIGNLEIGGIVMIQIYSGAYEALLGNISEDTFAHAASCIGQCTGCMCNCRCSCSGGIISDFEWEVV